MLAAYDIAFPFVQSLTPTWYKPQQVNFARLLAALLERPSLVLSELARALPDPSQSLHGKLKRIDRFLDNPRLDELALSARWLKLVLHFGVDVPDQPAEHPLLPILLDTVYFEPFAALLATVPCGSRGLPIAMTTYHRTRLAACFPPAASWPRQPLATTPAPRRGEPRQPSASVVTAFLSQNLIEQQLITLVWNLVSPALRAVLVADRGFARASLFEWLRAAGRDFVIRIDATTHVYLDPSQPSQPVSTALALTAGERRWCPQVQYGKDDRVPVHLLGVWEAGQTEPWYLVTSLDRADWTETSYRWRMRTECTHRDEKTGVLLREGGDDHALHSVRHLHRLLLVVAAAEWLSALAGLQAHRDLPTTTGAESAVGSPPSHRSEAPDRIAAAPPSATAVEPTISAADPGADPDRGAAAAPEPAPAAPAEDDSPCLPPPVLPHRGPTPKLPPWMKRFAARGHLSYVRLGLEVIRAEDLGWVLRRMVHWLARFLWLWTPLWRPWQHRYRRLQRWPGFG